MINSYITLFPLPGQVIYLEASETRTEDRRLEQLGVFSGKPEKRTAWLPVLQVTALHRAPNLVAALGRVVAAANDPRTTVGKSTRLNLTVDVSDSVAGPVAARRVFDLARTLRRCRVAIIDSSVYDLPAPERRGWRVMVGRRTIVSTMFEALEEDRLRIDVPREIAREAADQVKRLTTKPDRGDLTLEEEVLARTVALSVWIQAAQPKTA